MNSVESILLVVLGVAFAVLLILSIVLVVIIIGIVKNIRHITQKAEETTDSFADIAVMIGKKVAPVAFSTAAAVALRRFRGKK
jgi:Na+-transporting methylmalonyl-CoA/oxaloacetate decarboxylase gamma subunit